VTNEKKWVNKFPEHFYKMLRGKEDLWKVFWIWGVLGNISIIYFFVFYLFRKINWNYAVAFVLFYASVSTVLMLYNRNNPTRTLLGLLLPFIILLYIFILFFGWLYLQLFLINWLS
jgi:hypothetical protein